MSAQLNFTIENQTITRTDEFHPVAKSQNYLRAGFSFSDDWGSSDRIAIFRTGSVSYEMLLDGNDECVVPWEAIKDPGWLYVSVYSGDRITAGSARVTIYETGFTEDVSSTEDPTIDVYASLMARMDEIETPVKDVTVAGVSIVDENGIAAISNIGESTEVQVSDTEPVIDANSNTRYLCGEITSLEFTPCASGMCEVIFSCGNTPASLTLPETVKMPEWFEVDANHTYDISIVDGIYGAVMIW